MENKNESTSEQKNEKKKRPIDDFTNQVEIFASKTAESIKKVIDKTLSTRNKVLTIRVNDESNKKLNALVEACLFKSRSESAAFLIQQGIKSQESLFIKIAHKMEKLDNLKQELKNIISEELEKNVTNDKKNI